MKTGLVIGKFYPFHLGHMYLVDVARANCDDLTVLVCDHKDQTISGSTRASWIKELYPSVDVRILPDTLAGDDTPGWAKYTIEILGRAPDVVFTSEDYGEPYARAMGSKHFLVNKERTHVPISGTKIRSDILSNWDFLSPPVRSYFAERIVVLGAESTGTTTLAKALAEKYNTVWVPEYGREYCLRKNPEKLNEWSTEEFVHIAAEQTRQENEYTRQAKGVLICDTDAFTTTVWHKRYMGFYSPQVEHSGGNQKAALYIVTGDEIPFVQDGTRDGEHIRHEMHQWFIDELERTQRKYIVVRGTHEERMLQTTEAIEKLSLLTISRQPVH